MNSITTSDAFKAMRNVIAASTKLPPQVFFTPGVAFWMWMLGWIQRDGIEFIDCGCGMGILIEQAKQRGVKIRGVDFSKRQGQHKEVEQQNALDLRWGPKKWPLICRPSHDGWCEDVIRNAQRDGACAVYVGLPSNYQRDIGMFRTLRIGKNPVGVGGEMMYLIQPLKGKSK